MLHNKDIHQIDFTYFDIIEVSGYNVVLRSRNTGHYWHLLERESNGHRSFVISHRHHESGPYHLQTYRPTINDCCSYIKHHDAFHLQRISQKKSRRLRKAISKRVLAASRVSNGNPYTDPLSLSLHRGAVYRAAASLIHPRKVSGHHGEV